MEHTVKYMYILGERGQMLKSQVLRGQCLNLKAKAHLISP